MAHLSLALWALPATGPAVQLPDLTGWTVSPTDGDWGSVEFSYPREGRNVALLLALADNDVDLRVDVVLRATDGRVQRRPAILLESSTDDVAETGDITVNGHFTEYEFGEVVLPYAPGAENGETVVSGNAGQIMGPLLTAAQGRGCLAGVTWSFTGSVDSAGRPWTHTGNLKFSPGQTYAALLGTLTGYGLSEWEFTNTRELRLYDGEDGKGVDRTVGPAPLTLERGRDLADAPRKHTLLGAATALVAAGKDGLYSLFSDATAQGRRGRRIEQYASFGNAADQGTLDALTSGRLGTLTSGKLELSHKLVLGEGHPTPLFDVQPADYVFSATRAGVKRRRVRQVTLKGAAGTVTEADVTVGALIDEWAVRQQKRLDDLASGAAVVGTSTPPPEVDDGSIPATPTGLVAAALWYPVQGTPGLDSITALWTADPDDRTVGYVVEWHYVDAALGSQWQQLPQTDLRSITWSGVAPGQGIAVRVSAVNKWGRLSDPSSPYTLTTLLSTTPPPVLPAPTGSAYLGLTKWDWAGKGNAGESMPGNFSHAELHLSTTANFTVSRPLLADGRTLDTAASTTYRDRLTGAGELPVDPGGAYGVTWYAKWVAVNRDGLASAASAQGSAVKTQAADGDVSALNIGKLTTGILTALLTISGIIRTSLSGARVEIDTTGLRCIGASGALLFEFNIPSSVLTIIGKLISGSGVGVGSTIVIDPGPPPRILLYPDATQQRYSMGASSTVRPGGSTAAGLQLNALNTAGQTDGFSIDAWSTNAWIGHKLTTGLFAGGKVILQRIGGLAGLYSDNGSIVVDNTSLSATINGGAVNIDSVGAIRLNPASGKELTASRPFGSKGAGFTFESQDGGTYPAQGIRTYAAEGTLFFLDNATNDYVNAPAATVAGRKTFVIDHPTDPARHLVHVAVEGPRDGVEYSGEVVVEGGQAVVELPDYFEALTRPDGRQVFVSVVLPDEPLTATIDPPALPGDRVFLRRLPPPRQVPEHALMPRAAASSPRDGRFRIACDGPDGTRVAWLVKAVRADVDDLDVEPLRADTTVRGDGPYRYIVEQREAA